MVVGVIMFVRLEAFWFGSFVKPSRALRMNATELAETIVQGWDCNALTRGSQRKACDPTLGPGRLRFKVMRVLPFAVDVRSKCAATPVDLHITWQQSAATFVQ